MKTLKSIFLFTTILITLACFTNSAFVFAQEKKGDLEDFADDHDDDDDDDCNCDDDDDASDFFLFLFFEHIGDVVRLWGGTPGTAYGPFPSFPYSEGYGFMANSNDYRSYFFNTELNYQYLNEDLRSYAFKWETQFVGKSKLSFDLSVYEEEIFDRVYGSYKDHLTFFGVRYGYALYRSPQMILNLEGGIRGLHYNNTHSGPEVALDLQLFPNRPLILETELAAAYVNGGAIYTVESSAGIAIGRVELLGGIRVMKNKSQDLLDGFRFGLRVWY